MLPPISPPNPKTEQLDASNADSPPEEPPGLHDGIKGFLQRPKILLTVSGSIKS